VEAGQEVVITRRGRPVARIEPIRGAKRVLTPEQEAAWARIEERMRNHPIDLGGYKFRREDAYEDI
jgi:prevent-host-death family protein